jgi:hypothetical protein
MARADLGAIANRLFEGFLAPLVLGGELRPGHVIGGRAALAIGVERVVADGELLSHVQLARTRVARKIAAVDRLENPSVSEWALGAALHDLVQSTHPRLRGTFRRHAPERVLSLVSATLERVPRPASVGEALSRHTWFSRVLEIQRTDTVVRWWVGSRTFLGTAPPPRLTAWPELRRVNVEQTPRPLVDLPSSGGAVNEDAFTSALTRLLAKTPLTDLATCARDSPRFLWSAETLGLAATRAGRTLALRVLSLAPAATVDAVLGQATRKVLRPGAWQAATAALDVLGERALAEVEAMDPRAGRLAPGNDKDLGDGAFARAAGAVMARQMIATGGNAFSETERRRMLSLLEPRATSGAARQLEALLAQA